jgi:hypothetical protein
MRGRIPTGVEKKVGGNLRPGRKCEKVSCNMRKREYVQSFIKGISSFMTVKCIMVEGNKYSILFYSILFYSILFYSILFYSILFYSILFYSILFYSIPFKQYMHCANS